jgi:hypothetical protein
MGNQLLKYTRSYTNKVFIFFISSLAIVARGRLTSGPTEIEKSLCSVVRRMFKSSAVTVQLIPGR